MFAWRVTKYDPKNRDSKGIYLTDESVGAVLKEDLSLENSRHRSILGFMTNFFATISAYVFRDKKPSISVPDTSGFKIC